MVTSYQDREDEFDLGTGHSFRWFKDSDGIFGIIEHHPPTSEAQSKGALYCGGYIAWREPVLGTTLQVKHHLTAGGEGDEGHITVEPSLSCNSCTSHGFIRDGHWESV